MLHLDPEAGSTGALTDDGAAGKTELSDRASSASDIIASQAGRVSSDLNAIKVPESATPGAAPVVARLGARADRGERREARCR